MCGVMGGEVGLVGRGRGTIGGVYCGGIEKWQAEMGLAQGGGV